MFSNESESSKKDLISIILPCYNASLYLEECLKSLLYQTYSHFELITIDDGSQDNTLEILNKYKESDNRIIVSVNATNSGIQKTLNKGIHIAKGKYIARMDADDIASLDRLEKQLSHLKKNPDIDILGTGTNLISEAGHIILKKPFSATTKLACYFISYFTAPIIHPTLIGKAEILKKNMYSESKKHLHIEDFELFHRLTAEGYAMSNLNEPLLFVRQHQQSTRRRNTSLQTKNGISLIRENIKKDFYIDLSVEDAGLFRYQPISYLPNRLRRLSNNFKMVKNKFLHIYPLNIKNEKEIDSFIAYILAESLIKQMSHQEYWRLKNLMNNLSDLRLTGVLKKSSLPYIIGRIVGYFTPFLKSKIIKKNGRPF